MNDAALIERFKKVRTWSEALCAPFEVEAYCFQAMADVSPPKWHLAFAHLFNSYYETAGTFFQCPQRGTLSRPTAAEVYRYRSYVEDALLALLVHPPKQHAADIRQRTLLRIDHEIQHQELLLMDTRYNFFVNPLHPAYHIPVLPQISGHVPAMDWQEFAGGTVEIGHEGDGFSYDNERPRHKTSLKDFRLATQLVTNEEYMAFIDDGAGALMLFGAVQATMIIAGFIAGERMSRLQTMGFMAAVTGLLILMLPGVEAPSLLDALLMLASGTAWGVYSLFGCEQKNPAAATAGNFIRAAPLTLCLSLAALSWLHTDARGALYAVLSGAVTSALGYVLWYRVLQHMCAMTASTVQLSAPVIASPG